VKIIAENGKNFTNVTAIKSGGLGVAIAPLQNYLRPQHDFGDQKQIFY
jgi:hypothetical protein